MFQVVGGKKKINQEFYIQQNYPLKMPGKAAKEILWTTLRVNKA